MKKEIMVCDLCGCDKEKGTGHWSNRIASIKLSFEKHPSIQTIVFEGDVCATCGIKLKDVILETISSIKIKYAKE